MKTLNTMVAFFSADYAQCLALNRHTKEGERIDNITDWALQEFRIIIKEFSRMPFYNNFWQWAKWSEQLMNLHTNYETIESYILKRTEITYNKENTALHEKLIKAKLKADKATGEIFTIQGTHIRFGNMAGQ